LPSWVEPEPANRMIRSLASDRPSRIQVHESESRPTVAASFSEPAAVAIDR